MSDIVERIDVLLAQRNENRNNLQKIGISHQTVSQWSTKDRIPRADDLHKIANYLGVTMEFLLTGEFKNISADEINIICKIRLLSADQKGILLNQLEYMVQQTLSRKKETV